MKEIWPPKIKAGDERLLLRGRSPIFQHLHTDTGLNRRGFGRSVAIGRRGVIHNGCHSDRSVDHVVATIEVNPHEIE